MIEKDLRESGASDAPLLLTEPIQSQQNGLI
jgi:hypothetical protein